MADENTKSEEDSTATSAFAGQTDKDVESCRVQTEMADPVGIDDDHTHDRSSSNAGYTSGCGRNMGAELQVGVSNPGFPAAGPRFQAYQNSPVQTVEDALNPGRKRAQIPGQQFPADQNSPLQTVEDALFPERKRRRLPGQVMPVVRASGPTQACDILIGPSITTRLPTIVRSTQQMTRLKTPSTRQSTSESAQAAPSLTPVPEIYTVPPQAQTAASISPFPTTAAFLQPASRRTTLLTQAQTAHPPAPLAKETPLLHVSKGQGKAVARGSGLAQASNASVGPSQKRGATQPHSICPPDSNRLPQPIEYRCCICNLHLSLKPEGLVLLPGFLPSTTVLQCGHRCHVFCLHWITVAYQNENPPCIECQMREMRK